MPNEKDQQNLPLEDDRRIKTLSPGTLTARRFFRNRLAVAGLVILTMMFLFSFVGGALIPYGQEQVFYRQELQQKAFAGVSVNEAFRFHPAPGQTIDPVLQAQMLLALQRKKESLSYQNTQYTLGQTGTDFYEISVGDSLIGFACKDIFYGQVMESAFHYRVLKAYANGQTSVGDYRLQDGGVYRGDQQLGQISRLIVQARAEGVQISQSFRRQVADAIENDKKTFTYEEKGKSRTFTLSYEPTGKLWSVKEETLTRVWDAYASPSRAHPLGTDKNGMDMLTRLMYGGRVSLVIGFLVVLISGTIGMVLGGVAGYFGGWVDNLIMRVVDVFYCVPSTPVLIILGAAMDALRVEPQKRMLLLMLILGLLGWPGIARLLRGQILSLREQEFMTATESSGLRVSRRIFRHLLPNVIPQLIVVCTMSLGSTILTEATLSFLGLGVKFPFASWGNIMNDVSNAHVLTSYWFVWLPAGICLVLAVLGFNFVGDGLRDAFDPKMKR